MTQISADVPYNLQPHHLAETLIMSEMRYCNRNSPRGKIYFLYLNGYTVVDVNAAITGCTHLDPYPQDSFPDAVDALLKGLPQDTIGVVLVGGPGSFSFLTGRGYAHDGEFLTIPKRGAIRTPV